MTILIVTLTLISTTETHAANIAGTTCKVKNTIKKNGKDTYKCTAVGKKLLWQKFNPTPTPRPEPTPSPTPTPIYDDNLFPPNSPAPARTCLTENAKARVFNAPLTCKNGKWILDAGVVIVFPSPVPSPTPSPTPTPTPTQSVSNNEVDTYPPNVPAPQRSCPNEGSSAELFGGKMTCKSGLWVLDPGQVIGDPNNYKKIEPIPTITASKTPYKSNPERSSSRRAIVAQRDIINTLKVQNEPTSSFRVINSPLSDKTLLQNANKTLPTSLRFWGNVYSPKKPISILLSSWSERDWMVNAAREAGDTKNGYESISSWFDNKPKSAWEEELGSGMHEGLSVEGETPKIVIVVSGPGASKRPGGTTTWPHEFVHNVQSQLMPTKANEVPCWFYEGTAQYYGLVLSYPDTTDFLANRREILLDREFGSYPFDAQKSLITWRESAQANENKGCGSTGGYWIGMLMVEKLVADYGSKSIISLMKEIEISGNFSAAFTKIYGITISDFYFQASLHIFDTVEDLLEKKFVKESPYELNIISKVEKAVSASKQKATSSLISIKIEKGAMTESQEIWIRDAIQFINYLSPPLDGAQWELVFPTTMSWFRENWDMSKETQRYKDMFDNNSAEQLVGSVHSYGTAKGGWAASFFVSQKQSWFNPDWQMRFIAQMLKPIGYSSGEYGNNFPEWFTRTFAYPIGAAYSQLTSSGKYSELRDSWVDLFCALPQPVNLGDFEISSRFTGPESEKSPGALADEILISQTTLDKSINFLKDTYMNKLTWEEQLEKTFGLSKKILYAQIAELAKS